MNITQKYFQFLSDDKWMVFLLISIFLLIFVIYPIGGISDVTSIITNIFFTFVLFSGLMSVSIDSKLKRNLLLLLTAILLLSFAGKFFENSLITHLHLLSRILFLWILIILIFKRVFGSSTITFFYRLVGSLTIYLLIGFIWANMYFILFIYSPGLFYFNTPLNPENNLMFDFIYFSFEVLTTLGFGDILPKHPITKTLVILEALIGPLYLAILIGRLVSTRRKLES